MKAPESGHCLGVYEFEDALFPVRPFDVAWTRVFVLEQLEQEFPKVSRGALSRFPFHWNAIWAYLRLASFLFQLME